ncbi:MAG: FkbM family methyltransferase [Pseudomonadota bacterium]
MSVPGARPCWRSTPALEVHAFEPARDNFAVLAAKRLPQVVTNNVGLGARAEQRELYTLGTDTQLRSLYRREGLEDDYKIETPRTGEPVALITLDEYCATRGVARIDYLKIDTEGHDLQVLRGRPRHARAPGDPDHPVRVWRRQYRVARSAQGLLRLLPRL